MLLATGEQGKCAGQKAVSEFERCKSNNFSWAFLICIKKPD